MDLDLENIVLCNDGLEALVLKDCFLLDVHICLQDYTLRSGSLCECTTKDLVHHMEDP